VKKKYRTIFDLSPHERNTFAQMWRSGVNLKALDERFKIGHVDAVSRIRNRLGLEPRWKQGQSVICHVQLRIAPDTLQKAKRRAHERHTSLSRYIRYLIERDM